MTRSRHIFIATITVLTSALVLGAAQRRATACEKGASLDRAMEGAAVAIIGTPIDIAFGSYRLYKAGEGERPGPVASTFQVMLTAPQVYLGMSAMFNRDGLGPHPVILGVTALAGVLMVDGFRNMMIGPSSSQPEKPVGSSADMSWTPTVMSDGDSASVGVLGRF